MQIEWINFLPEEPQEFLRIIKDEFSIPLQESFKLFYLTLQIKTSSDSPIYKFLERLPYGIKFDEIGKREFLMSFSIFSLRELLEQHFDLKLVKNLFLELSPVLPSEFFKGVTPKHSIVVSQDIALQILKDENKKDLPSFLKAKHLMLKFKFLGSCEELIRLTPYLINPFFILKKEENLELYTAFSISELVIFSLRVQKIKSIRVELDRLLENFKVLFPDCFGEI